MKLEKVKIPDSLTASIHITGKIGFSAEATKSMGLDQDMFLQVAVNTDDVNDQNLYVFVTNAEDENSLKISKAGNYFYANSKSLFDKLEIDYRKKKVMFDIVEIEYEGEKIYKFIRREKDRDKSK